MILKEISSDFGTRRRTKFTPPCGPCFNSQSKAFKDSRSSHTSTNAHGNHSVTRITALQFADEASGEFCPRAAKGMAKGDCAAIRIHTQGIKVCLLDYR